MERAQFQLAPGDFMRIFQYNFYRQLIAVKEKHHLYYFIQNLISDFDATGVNINIHPHDILIAIRLRSRKAWDDIFVQARVSRDHDFVSISCSQGLMLENRKETDRIYSIYKDDLC